MSTFCNNVATRVHVDLVLELVRGGERRSARADGVGPAAIDRTLKNPGLDPNSGWLEYYYKRPALRANFAVSISEETGAVAH